MKKIKTIMKNKQCKTCRGYGLWAIGDASPMGPIDASEGYNTIPCPTCGANQNPLKTKERTKWKL